MGDKLVSPNPKTVHEEKAESRSKTYNKKMQN